MRAREVFDGSDGLKTRTYYAELEKRGPIGQAAVRLFRAQKTSTRAKMYRGREYKSRAYDIKSWSMGELCKVLAEHGASMGFIYGWSQDPDTVFGERPSWVLYVEIPSMCYRSAGQVSFHSPTRGEGPDYDGTWDGQRASEERILAFCDVVYGMPEQDNPNQEYDGTRAAVAVMESPIVAAHQPLRFGDPDSIARARRRKV